MWWALGTKSISNPHNAPLRGALFSSFSRLGARGLEKLWDLPKIRVRKNEPGSEGRFVWLLCSFRDTTPTLPTCPQGGLPSESHKGTQWALTAAPILHSLAPPQTNRGRAKEGTFRIFLVIQHRRLSFCLSYPKSTFHNTDLNKIWTSTLPLVISTQSFMFWNPSDSFWKWSKTRSYRD